MNILGFDVSVRKSAQTAVAVASSSSGLSSWWNFGPLREVFAGQWQRNILVESLTNVLAFSAVYACVVLESCDVSKLRVKLMRLAKDGVWDEVTENSPFLPVLRKPNRYQTRIQFLAYWMTSKLLHGNAYILKERDARGVVVALYCLDPRCVTPLVAPDGEVFYRLHIDPLAGVETDITVPASEIIHDRMVTLWHPLVGVSPIYACGASATQGIRIQNNSEAFFKNMSRPSGMLTAPGVITAETAARLKAVFEESFAGTNLGRLFVGGDGLKYEPMTIPAQDAQLIEQQKWTVEDVARAFGVPLYKIQAGALPTFNNVGALNQEYYGQTLQVHIEAIELLLDEALGLPALGMGTEFDLDGLLRMDPLSLADMHEKLVRASVFAPDDARRAWDLHAVPGGNSPMAQQQNYSLAALAKRDAKEDPFATAKTPVAPAPKPEDEDHEEEAAKAMRALIVKFTEATHAEPA